MRGGRSEGAAIDHARRPAPSPLRWTSGMNRAPTRRPRRSPAACRLEEVFEIFARYAARDFRSIGHKAIYVANAWRTLETIGWQHSEPVLRSLAYALLAREGSDPLKGDAAADRPWRRNQGLVARVRADWGTATPTLERPLEMLAVLRDGSDEETADACRRPAAAPNRSRFHLGRGDVWRLRAADAQSRHPLAPCRDDDQRDSLPVRAVPERARPA